LVLQYFNKFFLSSHTFSETPVESTIQLVLITGFRLVVQT